MHDVELSRLRELRGRAETLLTTLVGDMRSFQHPTPGHGFMRTPESTPGGANDINITTTCSCMMALALTGKLSKLYGDKVGKASIPAATFRNLVNRPWMSSGLVENNGFTTALVIRLHGILSEAGALPKKSAQVEKAWEPTLRITKPRVVAERLFAKMRPVDAFLFDALHTETQDKLRQLLAATPASSDDSIRIPLVRGLSGLVNAFPFYSTDRFSGITLSEPSTDMIGADLDDYRQAHLNRLLLYDLFPDAIAPLESVSLEKIAEEMSKDLSNFGINTYPPSAAVVYWFVDGVHRAGIPIPTAEWLRLCRFAANEFSTHRSRVVAEHAAIMDPVALAMSACLCARLLHITSEAHADADKSCREALPSMVELETALTSVFKNQTESGIWPKYFPLFHYQAAGSNYCYSFEMLEALLVEFGRDQNRVLADPHIIAGLERAVTYCEATRVGYRNEPGGREYEGWNSGGDLKSVRKGQPESWATAVVHMFLWELTTVLSQRIQHRLLDAYRARRHLPTAKAINSLLDISLWLDDTRIGLKAVLHETIVKTFVQFKQHDADKLRGSPIERKPLSALLFGPPGTSKTEVAKAIAAELEWPLVEIDPSSFLRTGFQNVYVEAGRIFDDAMDLTGVVVLFDEMDALVQKRDAGGTLDTEGKFLTTYMLPKLAKLHDRGRVVFLMATNFQDSFDEAIKRAGRFDLLLCMGPPTLADKCAAIHRFLGKKTATKQTRKAGAAILRHTAADPADPWMHNQLTLYTFAEFRTFVQTASNNGPIGDHLHNMSTEDFKKLLEKDAKSAGLKAADLSKLTSAHTGGPWSKIEDLDGRSFAGLSAKDDIYKLPAIRYVLDRQESRRQY